jgi:hypothetical protein
MKMVLLIAYSKEGTTFAVEILLHDEVIYISILSIQIIREDSS